MIDIFLFLKKYSIPYKVKIIECVLVIGILSLVNLPLPYLNGKCIDLLVLKEDGKYYIFLLLLICFLNIIKYLISVNVKLLIGLIGNNIVKDIKLDLLNKYLYASMTYIDKTNKGYFFSRINECENIRRLFSTSLLTLLLGIIDFLFSVLVIFFLNIKLSIITALFLPVLYFFIHVISLKIKKSANKVAEQTAKISSSIMNVLDNTRFIKILNLYDSEKEKVKKGFQNLVIKQNEQVKQNGIYMESVQLMSGIHNLIILAVAGYMIYSGKITIGLYITYMGYSGRVFTNILSFSSFGVLINPVIVSIQRLKEIEQIDAEDNGVEAIECNINEVSMTNIYFRYNKDHYIFENFNCKFDKNNITIIHGKNGSGKTTLISLLLGLYNTEKGEIIYGKKKINLLEKHSLRNYISYMSQEPGIFSGSLRDNLLKGKQCQIDIEQALKDLNLYQLLVAFQYDLNYSILHNGANLSGGQKQLISFLRIALQNRPIIILDEPTNSLDSFSKNIFIRFMKEKYLAKKIIIIITHDLALQRELEVDTVQIINI